MPPRITKNTSVRIHLDWSRLRSRASGPADAITQRSVYFPEQSAHPVQSLTDAQLADFIKTSEQLKSHERW